MNREYFHRLACLSFVIKFLKDYFITFYIINGLKSAIIFSFFIYLAYFHIKIPLLDTLLGLYALYLFLIQKREINFWMGFFVGLFWFYWIALSFRYYDMSYLIPFVVLAVSFIYAFIFLALSFFSNPFIRSLMLVLVSYLHPFNFSWFKPELIFVNSYIGVEKWRFAIVLLSLSLYIVLKKSPYKKFSLWALIIILFSFDFFSCKSPRLDMRIDLCDQKLPQDIKWNSKYKKQIIKSNFKEIEKAIGKNYDMVVLSESAFPLYLNREKNLLERLKQLSKKIVIVTGALRYDDGNFYNSTYYFINGKLIVADKVVLVPFGEYVPLPKILRDFINSLFFDGAEDFKTAKKPTTIKIKDKNFTNAICYEATEDFIYKNHPKYIIALSNNAWFTPSIEPTLQYLLLKYYAKLYYATIIHSANMGISQIVRCDNR